MKKRTGDPWMPGDRYGRSLPPFTDFAALRIGALEFMLHADHTYDEHPWHPRLIAGEGRGLGAELRLLGLAPDAVEARARATGAVVLKPATDTGHGWREVIVADPDGYAWAVGVPIQGL